MRHILTLLLIMFIITIFTIAFIIVPALTNPTGFVVAEGKDNGSDEKDIPSFRIYTKAVCANVSGFVVCHDELFASCGNFEYLLPKNDVNGQGVFSKDWKDPR